MSGEAMKLALEALKGNCTNAAADPEQAATEDAAITALRQALETEQEPVAWMHTTAAGLVYFRKKPQDKVFNPQPVYTAPPKREWFDCTDEQLIEEVRRRGFVIRDAQIEVPKREWVGLTDEEVWEAIEDVLEGGGWLDVSRTLEQALKEKNGG